MFIFKTLILSFDLRSIFYFNFIHCTIFKFVLCLRVVSLSHVMSIHFRIVLYFRLELRVVIYHAYVTNRLGGWIFVSGIRIKMNMHGDHNKSMFCLTELILIFSLYMN